MTSTASEVQEIGPYRVVQRLGSGGMGEVFKVLRTGSDQYEALKLLAAVHSGDVTYRGRFLREARILSGIRHPNVVAVHARGETDHRLWLALELVDGPDAARLLKAGGPMPLPAVVDIITGTATALDHVWQAHGITHRDVKPGNILVELDGDKIRTVKLADFGIAKHAQQASEFTKTNLALGTAGFISPEALRGQSLDGRSDMYSLACTAFMLLAGRSPFVGDTEAMVINGHLERQPPSITSLRPDLPKQLDRVFARVLSKHPEHRYATCGEFAAGLREVAWASPATAATVPLRARPPVPASAAPRPPRASHTRALVAAGVAVAVLLCGGAAATYLTMPAHKPVTDLAELMPPNETVSAAVGATVAAGAPVTDSSSIDEPAERSSPVRCSWFATGSLPRTSGDLYRSTAYTSAGPNVVTVQVQLIRIDDGDAAPVVDVTVDKPDQCSSVRVSPRGAGGADFAGTWSVREAGPVAGQRTVVATDPTFVDGKGGVAARTFARSMDTAGSLAVSASLTKASGGGVSGDDAVRLAGLVQTVLDRAAGK